MINLPIVVQLIVDHSATEFQLSVESNLVEVGMQVDTAVVAAHVPVYDGEYVFTPTQNTQIVPINGKLATDNITINPIPSNYGLITWNGSVLRVS